MVHVNCHVYYTCVQPSALINVYVHQLCHLVLPHKPPPRERSIHNGTVLVHPQPFPQTLVVEAQEVVLVVLKHRRRHGGGHHEGNVGGPETDAGVAERSH
jgi:hypothetical protein